MARRTRKNFLVKVFQRQLKVMTSAAIRSGAKALKRAVRAPAKPPRSTSSKRTTDRTRWSTGMALAPGGARRYYVYKPPGVKCTEQLPLVVMLHGCDQHAKGFAASTGMNRVAARERFIVLYPEQDRLSNPQACWNWFDTRNGRAQGEAAIIMAAIEQACLFQAVDRKRIALVGFSAGASMAALIASRDPARFKAVVMHSGVGIDAAHSSATALRAMRGRGKRGVAVVEAAAEVQAELKAIAPMPSLVETQPRPALLIIQGNKDHVVATANGAQAAVHWAAVTQARAGDARVVQRGARYPATIIDWHAGKRLVATLCEVNGLGHAWSGGAGAYAYSDPKGPDAARMIWAFAERQFALTIATK